MGEELRIFLFIDNLWLKRLVFLMSIEQAPRSLVEEINIELLSVIVVLELSSVDSEDVSNSLDDWEVFEVLSIEDYCNPILFGNCSLFGEGVVDDLSSDDGSLVGCVGEG